MKTQTDRILNLLLTAIVILTIGFVTMTWLTIYERLEIIDLKKQLKTEQEFNAALKRVLQMPEDSMIIEDSRMKWED